MSRENTVYMLGVITEKPRIKVDANGNFKLARVVITTIRRTKMDENLRLVGTPRVDQQYIISRHPQIIEKRIVPLKIGDAVLVKGTLSTKDVSKSYICPYCEELCKYDGSVMTYIDPIFIERVYESEEGEKTTDDLIEKLKSKSEISNYCYISGTVINQPDYFMSEDGKKEECHFQIAINRKRRIVEDGPDKTVDYPFVSVFGKNALETSKALHMGSSIFINGAIQSRMAKVVKMCTSCEKNFQAENAIMEIVPYSLEYLQNCDIPESKRKEEEDNIKKDYKDLN